uniref:Prostaglandin E2 receptor EP4 subtype-like n=1 Tax=Crassostrea virginica TaxID=6565 RepID=A0A8B8E7B9_CRAVI|nr:prostaglandin E2 receptor EP4 subtype-like [Crassostrea virginica]
MTDPQVSQNSTQRIWESSVPPALQFAFGVIGNAIALVVLVLSAKTHRWRPFYRLVCGLAVTDGGGILLVYPTVMVQYAENFQYKFPTALCNYSSFVYTFTLMSSALIICAMSLDRFFAILYPFQYNSRNKGRRTNCVLAVIWMIGLVLSTLHLMGLGSSYNYYPKSWCFLNFVGKTTEDRTNSFLYSIVGLLALCCTIGVNIAVILSVCRNMRENSVSAARRFNKYTVVFLLVIVIVFTTCWAPLMVVIFCHAASLIQVSSQGGDGPLELLVLRFAVTNSIIDPWIYILLRKETLDGLKKCNTGFKKRLGIINESILDNSVGRNSERRKYQTKVTETGSTAQVTMETNGGTMSISPNQV